MYTISRVLELFPKKKLLELAKRNVQKSEPGFAISRLWELFELTFGPLLEPLFDF
jgi:hypothetical protein